MALIATAVCYLNRVDQDCGTTFSWVTRAMGPAVLDRRLGDHDDRGFAGAIYHRRDPLDSVRNLLLIGVGVIGSTNPK